MPSLCSMECARRVVARAERAVLVDQELGHQKQRDAPVAGRRIGQPRQHEVDDVVGEVVLAVGDEDFLPGDAVGAVGCALGLGAQRADVGARLRLGELHGAHPFAGHELAEIDALELVGAIGGERLGRAHGQHRADAEGHRGEFHISMQAALSACGSAWPPNVSGRATAFHPAAAQER